MSKLNNQISQLAEEFIAKVLTEDQKRVLSNLKDRSKPKIDELYLQLVRKSLRGEPKNNEERSPYAKPEWIGGYPGWMDSIPKPNWSNTYIGLYREAKQELIQSIRYEF